MSLTDIDINAIDNHHIDVESGVKNCRGNVDIYIRMLVIFDQSNINTVNELLKGNEQQDFSEIAGIAHKLINEASIIAANQLVEVSREIELSYHQNQIEKLSSLIPTLCDELTDVLGAIKQLL